MSTLLTAPLPHNEHVYLVAPIEEVEDIVVQRNRNAVLKLAGRQCPHWVQQCPSLWRAYHTVKLNRWIKAQQQQTKEDENHNG